MIPMKKRSHGAEIQVGLRFREKRECLGEKKKILHREKSKRSEIDFTLDLFKENVSRWIEDLWRFCQALILDR